VRGFGFGLVGNIIVGILGAILAGWLLGAMGLAILPSILNAILTAFLDAVVLLLVVRLIKRARSSQRPLRTFSAMVSAWRLGGAVASVAASYATTNTQMTANAVAVPHSATISAIRRLSEVASALSDRVERNGRFVLVLDITNPSRGQGEV
jgi:uncharacterized membrane protein YeaQ/YmgE (transglycosylase-associated protein family)